MLESQALVVDDDPEMVAYLDQVLRSTVRSIDGETSSRRALELFTARRHPIVLLDLLMPEIPGLELLRKIQVVEPRTQVIILTGHADLDSAVEAVNLHAFRFLQKPSPIGDLRRAVIDAFAHYQALPSAPIDEVVIAALYDEVAQRSRELELAPADPQRLAAYQQSFDRLRRAQLHEAELASRAFRDNLALQPGAGYSSIEAARRVLDREKDPS